MRRVLLVITVLAVLATACGDGSGAPVDANGALPESNPLDQPGDQIPTEAALAEQGDSTLSEVNEPLELASEGGSSSSYETVPSTVEITPEDEADIDPPAPPPTVVASPPPAVTGEVPPDLVAAILADAESRNATGAAITVVRAQAVTWPDGSLGCPEKDMSYTQALVDGYWVVLDAGGQELDYRAGTGGDFKYCALGGLPPVGSGNT